MKTYEYRLRPNKKQEAMLLSVLESSRKAYNQCLQEVIEHYEKTGKHLNMFAQDKLHGKTQHPDIPAVVLDTTIKRLHTSFANFFNGLKKKTRKGFPRFKAANRWNSIQFRDSRNHPDGKYFKAGKMCGGNIRFVLHRPMEGEFRFARIVKRPSGWYLQCVCDSPRHILAPAGKDVGLDVGLKTFVADSDGSTVKNPKFLIRSSERLARSQHEMCRKTKGSRRRRKAARNVAKIHEKIANQRRDFLHKTAVKYVTENDRIAVEDLNISGMVRNHSLSRGICDASWGMFVNILSNKAEDAGRRVITVLPQWTSVKCSGCGAMVQKTLSVRTHVCWDCGLVLDRDVNAALNILEKAWTGPSWSGGEGTGEPVESPAALKREAAGL